MAAIEHRHMLVAAGGYDGRKYRRGGGDVDVVAFANLRKPRQLRALCAKGELWAIGGFDGKGAYCRGLRCEGG